MKRRKIGEGFFERTLLEAETSGEIVGLLKAAAGGRRFVELLAEFEWPADPTRRRRRPGRALGVRAG
jgi:hypothetical protein